MKICLFSIVTYWHGIKGGMEIHVKLLSEGLVRRGHEVTVISSRHPEGKEFEDRNGVGFYYLRNAAFGARRKGWREESLKKFLELDKKKEFDLICCQQPIISKRLVKNKKYGKIASVIIMEGHEGMMFLSELRQTLNHKKEFRRLIVHFLSFLYYYFFWEMPLLKRCSAIVAVSRETSKSIQRWFSIDSKKIYTVYNGVDTEAFQPSNAKRIEIRKSYNVNDDEKLLLFMSFVTKQKGVHLLLNALPEISKKIEKVKMMVVGDGDYLEEAKEMANKLGVEKKVIFAGYVPHQETPKYINASDLFVLPTIRQEGLPFALVEVMSCQKPVIASRIGGIPSVINDGENGILINPGNITELISKTIYLFENEGIALEIARKARERVIRQFSLDRMIEETISVFETAAAESRNNDRREQ